MEKLSQITSNEYKNILFAFIVILVLIISYCFKKYNWQRKRKSGRDYYRMCI